MRTHLKRGRVEEGLGLEGRKEAGRAFEGKHTRTNYGKVPMAGITVKLWNILGPTG